MNVIEVHHLTKTFGKSRGIEDVSFQVEEGEILGISAKGSASLSLCRS